MCFFWLNHRLIVFIISLSFFLVSQVDFPSHVYADSCRINNDGLVSWWSFNKGSGIIAEDLISDNDGALINGPSWVIGKVGSALSFDGTNDYVRIPASENLNITGNLTVELWAKRKSLNTQEQILLVKGAATINGNDAPTSYALGFNLKGIPSLTNKILASFERDDGSNADIIGPEVTDTEFHHYVYARETNTHKLFLDGILVASEIFVGTPGDTDNIDFILGALQNENSFFHFYGGVIDEVKIYNRALSECEVIAAYTGKDQTNIVDLDVPWMSQRDPQWNVIGGIPVEYDFAKSWSPQRFGIDRWGCALTSAAMILNYHGVYQGVALNKDKVIMGYFNTNPVTLNSWLINNHGYTQWGGVIWSSITKYAKVASEYAPSGSHKTFEFDYPAFTGIEQVKTDIGDEIPGILRLVHNGNTHFVVTRGIDGTDDILLNDPDQLVDGTPPHSLNDLYPVPAYTRTRLARFVPSETDMSYMWMFGEPGTELAVDGSGFEILNDFGFVESLADDIEPDLSGSPAQFVYGLPKPDSGNTFMVTMIALPNEIGLKTIDIRVYNEYGDQHQYLTNRLVGEGEEELILIKLNESLSGIEDLSQVTFAHLIADLELADSLKLLKHPGYVKGWITQVKVAEQFYNKGQYRQTNQHLGNLLDKIEKLTPKVVDSELSELLGWELGNLIENLNI